MGLGSRAPVRQSGMLFRCRNRLKGFMAIAQRLGGMHWYVGGDAGVWVSGGCVWLLAGLHVAAGAWKRRAVGWWHLRPLDPSPGGTCAWQWCLWSQGARTVRRIRAFHFEVVCLRKHPALLLVDFLAHDPCWTPIQQLSAGPGWPHEAVPPSSISMCCRLRASAASRASPATILRTLKSKRHSYNTGVRS